MGGPWVLWFSVALPSNFCTGEITVSANCVDGKQMLTTKAAVERASAVPEGRGFDDLAEGGRSCCHSHPTLAELKHFRGQGVPYLTQRFALTKTLKK